jgi:predicted O-methyltransferase YrrM
MRGVTIPTTRQLEAIPFRLLARVKFPVERLPRIYRPVAMHEVRALSLEREDAWAAVRTVAPDCDRYLPEFAKFWDDEVVSVAIEVHACFGGEWAGAGPVDFMEAFTLYALIREQRPSRVLELGFAHGVSSWVLASALVRNGSGELDTVDLADNGDAIPQFRALRDRGVIHPHFQDGIEFVKQTPHDYQLTFSDASHTLEFNRSLAASLRSRFPGAVHCYHEWSLSPVATRRDSRYVSMRSNLALCGERQAFEEAFEGYRHTGVPSSSGLGVITSRHAGRVR